MLRACAWLRGAWLNVDHLLPRVALLEIFKMVLGVHRSIVCYVVTQLLLLHSLLGP